MPGGRPRRQSPKYNSLQAMGENIRAIRKHMQLNQTDFGRMFGVTQMTVSYWERAMAGSNAKQIMMICYKCGVSADDLLGIPREWVKIK